MVVAGGRWGGETGRDIAQGNLVYKSKMGGEREREREREKRNERSYLYRPQFKNLISNDRLEWDKKYDPTSERGLAVVSSYRIFNPAWLNSLV